MVAGGRGGLWVVFRTLLERGRRARRDEVVAVIWDRRRRRGGGGRHCGKVQLTFWHGLRGRDGLQRVMMVDQVLSAFVLGRQIKLHRLPLVAALLQAAIVQRRRRRRRLVLGAPRPYNAPLSSGAAAGRVAGRRGAGTGVRINTTI